MEDNLLPVLQYKKRPCSSNARRIGRALALVQETFFKKASILPHRDNCMTTDVLAQVRLLMLQYAGRAIVPDIQHYRRIIVPRKGKCMFIGCTEPIAWEDASGNNFLCEGHYRTVRKWVEGARNVLISGTNR
ncbi:MAG: hypothetical protein LUQ40_03325 [Methanomicrobiales archaeon]|nr:hypothetical protein [Methanomicrobiales archaeon]